MSGREPKMTSLLMILCLLTSPQMLMVVDAGMCSSSSCLNGGQMIMPNSVFGYCRCRCPPHFSGPKCQFVSKRADVAAKAPGRGLQIVDRGTSSDVINSRDYSKRLDEFTRQSLDDAIDIQHRERQHARDSLTDFDAE